MSRRPLRLVAACLCLLVPRPVAAGEGVGFEATEPWSNVFGGAGVKRHYAARHPDGLDGRLIWSISVDRRTIGRGESAVTLRAGAPARLGVEFRAPDVKAGVILKTTLTVAILAGHGHAPLAQDTRSLWVFPPDPWADRRDWLESLSIILFDPSGKTTEVLATAGIPFRVTNHAGAIAELSDGLLLIGEGTSLREQPWLMEAMAKAAARGVTVLCLAPADGIAALPSPEAVDLPAPESLSLRHAHVITELDGRLDTAWPPTGDPVASRLSLRADRGRVVAEAGAAAAGWPWLELRYAGRGRVLVCGMGIIRKWDATPAARYMLAAVLERLAGDDESTSRGKERKD